MPAQLSVIIPTRDRSALLERCVNLLLEEASTLPGRIEIVVVDDGSQPLERDAAEKIMEAAAATGHAQVQFLRQRASGPAAARNRAIEAAQGDLLLFLGDDILALPGLLSSHLRAHTEDHPEDTAAVLGMADLPPEFCVAPFVKWWRRYNFRYDSLLSGRRRPDASFFFTNNLSVKRSFLLRDGMFDEAFPGAAYEDIELGCRLERRGMQLYFYPDTRAYHYHRIDVDTACRRMEARGLYYDLFRAREEMPVVSRTWRWLGNGPWMSPRLIEPLWRLARRTQEKSSLGPLNIVILMYWFWVGRGARPALPLAQPDTHR